MESRRGNTWLYIGIGVAVLAVACLIVCLTGTALVYFLGVDTPTISQGPSFVPAPSTIPPPPLESGIRPEDDLDTQMETVEKLVADLRGLDPLKNVPRSMLTDEELRERVINDWFEDYTSEEARDDTITLAAFGFVPPDFDLYNFYIDLLSEQVAGYYDPELEEFFVISENESLSPGDEITYAHEFVHVLQDQHFDLETFTPDDDEWYNEHLDEALARTALIEGDATLAESLYLTRFLSQDRLEELFAEYAEMEFPVLDSAPFFIERDLFFPYSEGYEFVLALYEEGGFDLINQAYTDPPTSTEQILHPERYLDERDDPQAVELADGLEVLGQNFREVIVQPFGEFYLRLYLERLIEEDDARQAAEGWDGDRYAVYYDEATEQVVLVMRTVWDSPREAEEFIHFFNDFGVAWMGTNPTHETQDLTCWWNEDVLCVALIGEDQTLVIRAPSQDVADSLIAQY